MFRAMFSPIIRSTWLYLQYLLVFTQVAAGTSRQQLGWTLPDTVNTVKCSWWWAKHRFINVELTSNNILLTIYIDLFQLIEDTRRQQLGWTLTDTVNTVKCSWRWAKTSPKTCKADLEYKINMYIYIYIASCWLFSQLYHDARIRDRQDY